MSDAFTPMEWHLLSKSEKYNQAQGQLAGILDTTVDDVANLANAAALLKEIFGWWWVGFYRKQEDELILGPFQGPVACTRIAFGKGVCGSSWRDQCTIVVPDVDAFPGHIACSAISKSEIVVPLWRSPGEFWGVLDVDSEHLAHFDDLDRSELENFCRTLTKVLS